MDSDQLMDFLDREKLLPIIKKNVPVIKKVMKRCLNADDEKVLLIADKGFFNRRLSPMLTATYLLAAQELGMEAKVALQEPKNKGEFAEEKILKALLEQEEENIVITNVSINIGRLTHITKSFRGTMRLKSNKFTSMSSLGALNNEHYPVVINAINIDYKKLQSRGKKLKAILDAGNKVQIKTKAGTNLKMSIKNCEALSNDGRYDSPGKGGNMPAGEVYIPPLSGSTSGKIVVDGSVRHRKGTILVKEPLIIKVKKGAIISIKGDIESKILKETLDWASSRAKKPENVWKIAELGIGINPNCKIIGQTTIDEKSIGTCHIANGSNAWFGGDIHSIIHLDHVLRDVTIIVDGKKIMDDGVPEF